MGTAHYKPSGKRHIPCVTRHVSLWMPEALEQSFVISQKSEATGEESASQQQRAREGWVKDIEVFILAIYDFLKLTHPEDQTSHPLTLTNFLDKNEGDARLGLLHHFYEADKSKRTGKPDRIPGKFRHETVRINSIWQSMPIEITIELHTEYFTFSSVIDLGYKKTDGLYDDANPIYETVREAFSSLDRVTTERYEAIKEDSGHGRKGKDRIDLQAAYATLYRAAPTQPGKEGEPDIWERLRRDVFGPAVETVGAPEKLGRVFGDLRGVLARRGGTPEHFIALAHPAEEDGLPHNPSLQDIIAGQPFGGDAGQPFAGHEADEATRKARMTDIIQCIDAVSPFMLADVNLAKIIDGQIGIKQTELSFSTVFDERGIHISAVSLQNPDPNVPISPLTFFVLMTRGDGWELGRLVDIGNRLNTLRLAALY